VAFQTLANAALFQFQANPASDAVDSSFSHECESGLASTASYAKLQCIPSEHVITMSPVATKSSSTFALSFGLRSAAAFDSGLPVLAGEPIERLFGEARPAARMGPLERFEVGVWSLGVALVPTSPERLESDTHRIYREVFETTRHLNLARIWNYVPGINEPGAGGLENYRVFCRGRSLAFEGHHGSRFKASLPAASAVGTGSSVLTVAFAATRLATTHLENPLQVPAYEYPEDYGPRSPSFARATVVPTAGRSTVFISGTAAIRGHASMAPAHTLDQLDYTVENLQAISAAAGLGPSLGADRPAGSRSFKVYLRHPRDHPAVAAVLAERLFRAGDAVSYLQANICREALAIEIEATLMGEG